MSFVYLFPKVPDILKLKTPTEKKSDSGLEAAFQVPMPGDSGSSPDAGSMLDPGDFHSNPSGLLSFNKSETVLWTIAKILLLLLMIIIV